MRASPIEILWSASAFIGLIVSILTLIAYAQYRSNAAGVRGTVAERRNALQLANDYLWAEGRRFAVHLFSLQVGIFAMLLTDPARCELHLPHVYLYYGLDIVLTLIGINIITTFGSLGAYRGHLRWKRIIEDERAMRLAAGGAD